MKSFTASSFPTENPEILEHARKMVQKDPRALFTDFQWFLYQSKNTVYFTAFSTDSFTDDRLHEIVTQMVSLAPQLTHGFKGATPGFLFSKHLINEITSIEETDNFDAYPDKWLTSGSEIFEHPELPLFRVRVVNRRDGADDQGRASMIMVQSSHALMEGSDSALLTRTQRSGHGALSEPNKKVPFSRRFGLFASAALSAPIHLVSAWILSPQPKEMGFKSLSFERPKLRRVANALGVRQRALMFALVMHAMNEGGKKFGTKKVNAVYTTLEGERQDMDDDFFRVRTVTAPFDWYDDLKQFIIKSDECIGEVEKKDNSRMQYMLNATFKAHRVLSNIFPFLYSKRFFRFNGNYDIVLTMVPPHHTYGNLTRSIQEPIYCGSHHPGANLCTFVPARQYVTLNFSMQVDHLTNLERSVDLLNQLDEDLSASQAAE